VEYYAQSEKQIDAKEYEKAIGTLRSLVRSFPKSPVAAKSEYAIGWIMENRLAQPDSARAQYKRVAKNYEGTAYALAASRRYTEEQQSDTTKKDTTKVKMNTPFPKPVRVDSVQRNTAVLKKDTVEQQPVPPEKDIESGRRNRPISKPKILNE
jgi:outer membrane protein assembly factor BamD (BamD/ComL family)